MYSLIPSLVCDFYKTSHRNQYPAGTENIYSIMVPRSNKYLNKVDRVVSAGVSGFVVKYLVDFFMQAFFARPEEDVVREYYEFIKRTLGVDDDGSHIRELHQLGYLPLKIKAIPEGESVPIGTPILTIENTHSKFAWLTNYFETLISCSLWQPMTSASIARKYYKLGFEFSDLTCDNDDHLKFQFHDFSMRGMSSLESAQISGLGHLMYFNGTDTIPAITYVDEYYKGKFAKNFNPTSIPATEHSVMCALVAKQEAYTGSRDETESYRHLIKDIYPEGFVSIVSDTYDFWHNIEHVLPSIKDDIMSRNGRVVIRPDSGDPVQIICGIPESENSNAEEKGLIQALWDLFGGTINEKGYKVLDPHIGAIYGDSITLERAEKIFAGLAAKGFASSNIVFGIGSYSYQGNTRDSLGFAIKATSIIQDGDEFSIMKDPKTDSGKKSPRGRVKVVGDSYIDGLSVNSDFQYDRLQTVFEDGVARTISIDDVRNNVAIDVAF